MSMAEVVDVVARLAGERWGGGRDRAPGRRLAAPPRRSVAVLARRGSGRAGQRRSPAVARPARAGRRHDGLVDRVPQARLVATQGAPRAGGDASSSADDPRARPGDRVRGRRLPQPLRVLGRRHGHADGARRPVHPRLRLLPRRHAPAACRLRADEPARVAEAVARMDLDHAVLTMVARDDLADGGMAHVAALRRGDPRRRPGTTVETLISDAKGSRDALRTSCSTSGPTCSTTTSRRSPGCSAPCVRRPVTPAASRVLARAKAAGLVDEVGRDGRPRRDRRRDRRRARRPGRRRMRHRHDRPVPAPDHAPPSGRPVGRAARVRAVEASVGESWASATSRPAR